VAIPPRDVDLTPAPEQVRDALTAKIQTIPEILRASLTWDQGIEMRDWQQVSVAADIDVYFCDPHAPWQRATCENTNGLLRQYFPRAPTCPSTAPWTSSGSPPSSTTDHGNA
jgi:IS30 family transposase